MKEHVSVNKNVLQKINNIYLSHFLFISLILGCFNFLKSVRE